MDKQFSINNTKPQQLLRAFSDAGLDPPQLIQLKNFLVKYKKEKFGGFRLSLGELEEKCRELSRPPESPDTTYVIDYAVHHEPQGFRIVFSTQRLLQVSSVLTTLHLDATYKTNWNGFPLLIAGCTDQDRVLHPVAMCLSSDEKEGTF